MSGNGDGLAALGALEQFGKPGLGLAGLHLFHGLASRCDYMWLQIVAG
jgi:hypothetical protein